MCELFACSSSVPVNINFSLSEFSAHGGKTGGHKDGWGICYYEGYDTRRYRGTGAASNSEEIEFIKNHDIESYVVLSHIRKASIGDVKLSNTQPFTREYMGRMISFVHNGEVKGDNWQNIHNSSYSCIGETDSEKIFCTLINEFSKNSFIDELSQGKIIQFFNTICRYGPANIIMTDGEYILVYVDVRHGRNNKEAPGLYMLQHNQDCKVEIEGLTLAHKQVCTNKVLLASVPLSTENWVPLDRGVCLLIKNGKIVQDMTIRE